MMSFPNSVRLCPSQRISCPCEISHCAKAWSMPPRSLALINHSSTSFSFNKCLSMPFDDLLNRCLFGRVRSPFSELFRVVRACLGGAYERLHIWSTEVIKLGINIRGHLQEFLEGHSLTLKVDDVADFFCCPTYSIKDIRKHFVAHLRPDMCRNL